MYGRQPKSLAFSPPKAFDPASYQAHLQAKLAELQMFVKSNITAAATSQKDAYDTQHEIFKLMTQCGYPYLLHAN